MGGACFYQVFKKHGEVFKCCCGDNLPVFPCFSNYLKEMAAFG